MKFLIDSREISKRESLKSGKLFYRKAPKKDLLKEEVCIEL